ncbi:MAG: alanine racemase [Defluviitaleaceae bacterium]|nr:alanine racemase [Defluviitaleaceae bacterium]MCL2275938.1 alanine racemase [Defluviitaleaceae bacterium]
MKIADLATPCVLVEESTLRRNIARYQALCNQHGKLLWPMVKTHKSTQIARMQQDAGASGFLCGTPDECEVLARAGISNIMYAYPVANQPAIHRVLALAKSCSFYARIDGAEAATTLNAHALENGVRINYTIIIDSGLHRFGVAPEKARALADALRPLAGLSFCGISTHPGHVYAASSPAELPRYVYEETHAISTALEALKVGGYTCKIISSGATPTFTGAVSDVNINILHPGNYVFNDAIQVVLGVATEADCALTVLGSVISHPAEGVYIIDAGTKTLGLDKGAHGNTAIKSFGIIKNHPACEMVSLSEEVGKIIAPPNYESPLRVGDKLQIIPNHACVPASLASCLILHNGEAVTERVKVDMRG